MKSTTLALLVLMIAAASASTAPAQPRPAAVDPVAGLYDLQSWACPTTPAITGYFSSYDRTGGNDDGFKGTWSKLNELPSGEQVIVDLHGPGCLRELWFTGPDGGYSLPWGKLRFHLDDEPAPRLEVEGHDLFTGRVPGFPRPLVADSFGSTGGNVSHVPIPFAKRLIVTTERLAGFYNAYYHLLPSGTPVTSWTGKEDLSPAVEAWSRCATELPVAGTRMACSRVQVPPGGRKAKIVELAKLDGPGVIRALRINPSSPLTPFVLNNTWLRIWFDDNESPAIDVPLGPFFGSALGEGSVRSLPIGMSPSGAYTCAIPMPFAKSARLALENRQLEDVGEVYVEVDWEPVADKSAWPADLHLHARWNREWPTQAGRDVTILDQPDGQGVYLGHCFFVEPYSPDNKQWWEGDLRIWMDGRRHPILQGTGHEDETLGGWSSRWLLGPYSQPLQGLPVTRVFPERADGQWNGAMSAYRFFAGGIPFRNGVRVTTEHGTENVVATNYAAVAYYYWRAEPGMVPSDGFAPGDAGQAKAHGDLALEGNDLKWTARFEGDAGTADAQPLTAAGRSGQSSEQFMLKIDPNNRGVLLRRLYRSAGRHSARLIVDGKPVTVIAEPETAALERWREQDVLIPAEMTSGREQIEIRIEPIEGSWNAFSYQAFCLR